MAGRRRSLSRAAHLLLPCARSPRVPLDRLTAMPLLPARRRPRRTLSLTAVVAVLACTLGLVGGTLGGSAAAQPPASVTARPSPPGAGLGTWLGRTTTHHTRSAGRTATATSAVTVAPTVRQPNSGEIVNPSRGQYLWMGYAAQPAGWPAKDVYYRDQSYWGKLEPTRGSYDFSVIEQGLQRAAAAGGRFGFRVMAFCPGCWMNSRSDWPQVTPSWLPRQANGVDPDWNSETFLAGWERLMSALGAAYANDPRLGWVEFGGYGKYGEWWVDSGTTKITTENAKRLQLAVLRAFPKSYVLINAMDQTTTLQALSLSPRVGLRLDCLGEPFNMFSMLPVTPAMQDRWRTAPIFTEWCGSATTTMKDGAAQVKQWHISTTSSGNMRIPYPSMTPEEQAAYRDAVISSGYRYAVTSARVPTTWVRGQSATLVVDWSNLGSAPTYDRWQVQVELADAAGTVVWSAPTSVNLRTVLPGARRTWPAVTPPSSLTAGTYAVRLRVTDPRSYLAPMNLSNTGTTAGGSLPLTTVTVL